MHKPQEDCKDMQCILYSLNVGLIIIEDDGTENDKQFSLFGEWM